MNGCARGALRDVARVFRDGTLTGISDQQVLDRFVESGDESAFEAILLRHGSMVLNVCRQLLRDPDHADDAFQAVFLVLIQKARSIRVDDSLGPWLYAVAFRVASRARANRRRLREREVPASIDDPGRSAGDPAERLEISIVVHEELGKLPQRLRVPLVLCYLEGMTHDRAASQIGCPVGTVRSRLARARGVLHKRMARRGLAVSAAAIGSALESSARAAAIPPRLRAALCEAATRVARHAAAASGGIGASTSVVTFLKGVLKMIRMKTMAISTAMLVAVGSVGFLAVRRAGGVDQVRPTWPPDINEHLLSRIGPDGRRIGVRLLAPERGMVLKSYYVGDLVVKAPLGTTKPGANGPAQGVRPMVDMGPIVRLIQSNVAPGTWKLVNERGEHIDVDSTPGQNASLAVEHAPPTAAGTITPFFLSISLIVKCKPEVHSQIGRLLQSVREVVNHRESELQGTSDSAAQPVPPPSSLVGPAAPAAPVPAPSGDADSRRKIEQLLDEVRAEVAKLPRQAAAP